MPLSTRAWPDALHDFLDAEREAVTRVRGRLVKVARCLKAKDKDAFTPLNAMAAVLDFGWLAVEQLRATLGPRSERAFRGYCLPGKDSNTADIIAANVRTGAGRRHNVLSAVDDLRRELYAMSIKAHTGAFALALVELLALADELRDAQLRAAGIEPDKFWD